VSNGIHNSRYLDSRTRTSGRASPLLNLYIVFQTQETQAPMDATFSPRLAPINAIPPPDVLRQILELASHGLCHDHPSFCRPVVRSDRIITSITHSLCQDVPDPLLLSHVCSRWRNLILDTPTMWASVFISSPRVHQLHLLNLWLERSQSCALDIIFDYSSGIGYRTFKGIVELLAENAERCTGFEFKARDKVRGDMPGTFGEFIQPGSFNRLKTISALFSTEDKAFLDDFAVTFFAPGSDLRVCRLTEPQALSIIPRINPTWSQNLTSLTLFAFGGDLSILPLISNSPSLISLTLGFSICEADPEQSVMVTLPKLRYLILRHLQEANFVLDWLTLPQLRNLSTVDSLCDGETAPAVWAALHGMLERSKCSLKYFSLIHERTGMTKEGYLVEQLASQNFSALTDLELVQKDMGNTIVEALTTLRAGDDQSSAHEFLPKLETLGLLFCSTDDGKLGLMVSSRFRRGKGTLKHITLGTRGNEHSHFFDRKVFLLLEKEGLTFRWTSGMI